MRPDHDFPVGLRNGLLEPKHCRTIGDALWLYIYLLDKQTRKVDKDGSGKVSNGVPVCDTDIAGTLGYSGRTISRWRGTLARGGYITARRTSYGYVYAITKPKKWAGDRTELSDQPSAVSGQNCPVRGSERSDMTGPEIGQDRGSDMQVVSETKKSNKRNKEAVAPAAAGISEKQMENELQKVWRYYLQTFDKQEILSSSRKKMGLAILARLNPDLSSDKRVEGMCTAVEAARYIVEHNPKKFYLSKWSSIFGKFSTFVSLREEYYSTNEIPDVTPEEEPCTR